MAVMCRKASPARMALISLGIVVSAVLLAGAYDMGIMLIDCNAARSMVREEFGSPLSVSCSKNWVARFGWGRPESLVVSVRMSTQPGQDGTDIRTRVEAIVAGKFRQHVDRIDVVMGAKQ